MTTKQTFTAGSVKNKIVASDLQEERNKCTFDRAEMTELLYGGPEEAKLWRYHQDIISQNPEISSTKEFFEMSMDEKQRELWRRACEIDKKYPDSLRDGDISRYPYFTFGNIMQGLTPIGLHYTMFMTCVQKLASPEQNKKWLPLVQNHKILGCYAQTEIGHGSNVAGLETTATLDKSTDEWIIHTPTVSATKFWPGDLGRFTTHACVFARCIADGNDYGVQPFLVQLRDTETFYRLKGVETGCLGPKIGYTSKDNGWAIFTHVRIPRENMFMGIAGVDKDGSFEIKGDLRVIYSIMMNIRLLLIKDVTFGAFTALQASLRYNSVRRQFKTYQGNKEERKIIDYQTQQHTFAPCIAFAFQMNLVGQYVKKQFKKMQDGIAKDDYSEMDETHHILAGLKGLFTDKLIEIQETCRKACGGAGFLMSSGIPDQLQQALPIPTYEGDNTVMYLQASRYAFKLLKWAGNKKKPVPFPFDYIKDLDRLHQIKNKGSTVEEILDLPVLLDALALRAGLLLLETSKKINESKEHAKVKDNELFARDKLVMAKAHFKYVPIRIFAQSAEQLQVKDKNIREIMLDLVKISAINELQQDSTSLFACGYFAPEAFSKMGEAMDILVKKIRPNMVSLAESWDMPDEVVPSSIGNKYGDIYETQLRWAQESRMNVEDKKHGGRPAYFEQLIKPFLKSDYSNYDPNAKL